MEMENLIFQWIGQAPTVASVIAMFFYFRSEIKIMDYRLALLEQKKERKKLS